MSTLADQTKRCILSEVHTPSFDDALLGCDVLRAAHNLGATTDVFFLIGGCLDGVTVTIKTAYVFLCENLLTGLRWLMSNSVLHVLCCSSIKSVSHFLTRHWGC